ncbi:hypothetical protein Tco_1320312 [Tanacetum coccineum]
MPKEIHNATHDVILTPSSGFSETISVGGDGSKLKNTRRIREEVLNVVKEREDVVAEFERLSGNHVVKEIARLLRRGQKRDLDKMTHLQIIVNESHLGVHEKCNFVSNMNLGTLAANSRGWFNRMLVYFDRENRKDLEFANDIHNLWIELLERTNERQLFITELKGLSPSVMTYNIMKFLNEVQNHDVIQLLELRKIIVGTHPHVSRKIVLIETSRTL